MPHVAVRPHVPAHIRSSARLLLSFLQALCGPRAQHAGVGRSVHTSSSGGVADLQFWAADNERRAEWTLRRRLQGAATRAPNAAEATTGPLPPGELHIPQWCKHLRVRISPKPFSTNISRNFYFQEIYPPGIPGGLHFHRASNYWKICSDQNCGEWRDRTH